MELPRVLLWAQRSALPRELRKGCLSAMLKAMPKGLLKASPREKLMAGLRAGLLAFSLALPMGRRYRWLPSPSWERPPTFSWQEMEKEGEARLDGYMGREEKREGGGEERRRRGAVPFVRLLVGRSHNRALAAAQLGGSGGSQGQAGAEGDDDEDGGEGHGAWACGLVSGWFGREIVKGPPKSGFSERNTFWSSLSAFFRSRSRPSRPDHPKSVRSALQRWQFQSRTETQMQFICLQRREGQYPCIDDGTHSNC